MNTRKLTVTMMFAASMAWASTASAGEPCGVPVDTFESCEVVQAPNCFDVCQPEAMAVACAAENADYCMDECGYSPDSITCDATCEQECTNTCAQALVEEGPSDCKVSCGASCMGECSASCQDSDDKVACFAACSQQCGAHCEVSCSELGEDDGLDYDAGPAQLADGVQDIDSGVDGAQEHNRGHHDDDDDDKRGARHDDDDDDKRGARHDDDDDDKRGARHDDDDDDKRGGYWDDDDDHKQELPATDGLDITFGCEDSCMQSCGGSCEAGVARDCELGCQTDALNICAPQMASSCSDACDLGAVLLCDGQYIQVDDINACVAELEKVGVPVSAAAFDGDQILSDALQGASCSVEEPNKLGFAAGWFTLLSLGLGAGYLRRRRNG